MFTSDSSADHVTKIDSSRTAVTDAEFYRCTPDVALEDNEEYFRCAGVNAVLLSDKLRLYCVVSKQVVHDP